MLSWLGPLALKVISWWLDKHPSADPALRRQFLQFQLALQSRGMISRDLSNDLARLEAQLEQDAAAPKDQPHA